MATNTEIARERTLKSAKSKKERDNEAADCPKPTENSRPTTADHKA